MPDGREEVDLEKVVVLFTDPEEVKQGRSQLVVIMVIKVVVMMVVMVVMVVVICIMIVISIFWAETMPTKKDLIHSGGVKQKCENVAKEGSKRSLDSRKVDSAR